MKICSPLKSIASYSKGEQINGDCLVEDGAYAYLNGGIQPSGKWTNYNTPANTVTISEGGNSCGYVNYMQEPFWCGAHCYYLYDTKLKPKYLYYALKSQQHRLMTLRSGACMPNIKKTALGNFEVTYDSDERKQSHVISVLQRIEAILASRTMALQQLDQLVKARFIEMFGDPLADNENTQRISSCCKIYTGNTPPMREASYYESPDIPFIKPGNLAEHGVTRIRNVEEFVSEKARGVARIMPPGAVLVTCIGTIGKIGIATRECCCNQQINFIIPNVDVDSIYLAHCLTCFVGKMKDMANAPVVPILNKSQFSSLEIPVPSKEKQNQFATFVSRVESAKSAVEKALVETQVLFDSLMQEYFG